MNPKTAKPPKAREMGSFFTMALGASLIPWYGAAAKMLRSYPPSSWEDKVMGYVSLFLPLVFWGVSAVVAELKAVRWKDRRSDSRAVLLDLGRIQPWRLHFAVSLCCCLALAQFLIMIYPPRGRAGEGLLFLLLWVWLFLADAIRALATGLTRVRITDRGLESGADLLPWNALEAYQWAGVGRDRLVLTLNKSVSRLVLWGRVKSRLRIPPAHREAVERLRARYLAGVGLDQTRNNNPNTGG